MIRLTASGSSSLPRRRVCPGGACAGEIGVSRQTLTAWADAHPEFLDAKRISEARSQLFWERKLSKLADKGSAGPGASTAIIFALKNRARDDWRDMVEQKHTGDANAPVVQRIERVIIYPPNANGADTLPLLGARY
jgi:hypothetical protein